MRAARAREAEVHDTNGWKGGYNNHVQLACVLCRHTQNTGLARLTANSEDSVTALHKRSRDWHHSLLLLPLPSYAGNRKPALAVLRLY